MKHAICIMGFGSSVIAQKTIEKLDDKDIDFFIHWDKKSNLPNFKSKYSKISYVDRVNVNWGSYDEIAAEINLLQGAKEAEYKYDYVHLISSTDIPLMTKEYFKKYFNKDAYIGFQNPTPKHSKERVSFYYPTSFINVRNKLWLIKVVKALNYIFRVNRLSRKNIVIKKGPQWFSINYKFIEPILNYDNDVFKHSYLGSEVFIQTILGYLDNNKKNDDNEQAARYIKWSNDKAPHPLTLTVDNISELKEKLNTKYAFARKIVDPKVVDKLYERE